MGYKCAECGVGYFPPRHCTSQNAARTIAWSMFTATKSIKAENALLRECIKAMYHAKSKSECKRICTKAGVDWSEDADL